MSTTTGITQEQQQSLLGKKFGGGLLGTVDAQMKLLGELRENEPDKSKKIFELGEQLLIFSERGELRKIRAIVDNPEYDQTYFMLFFISKMFKASLLAGHIMVASYIIDQGYPFNSNGVPNTMHEVLNIVDDYRGVAIIEFLKMKGIDIDMQAKKTWLTPLHIAIQRNLSETVATLILFGCDVNAVANGDIMPLNIAFSAENSENKENIIKILENAGAKQTWRKTAPVKPNMVSFSGGSSNIDSINNVFTSFSTISNLTSSTTVSVKGGVGVTASTGGKVTMAGMAGMSSMSNVTGQSGKSNLISGGATVIAHESNIGQILNPN
jgi:hypothetical protein